MRLAPAALILFATLAVACASRARAPEPAAGADAGPNAGPDGEPAKSEPERTVQERPDLARERALVEQARAAAEVVDLATARAKSGEAIEALLARPDHERDRGWLELLDAAGLAAWSARDASAAQSAWKVVLDVRANALPDDDHDLLASRLNLAKAMYTIGDLATARELSGKALQVWSSTLPDDDPDLQEARFVYAATILLLGDLQGALELQRAVYEVRSRTLPDEHIDLQRARLTLAGTLFKLGDLRAARDLSSKVVEIWSRTLPDTDPQLQSARYGLAITLYQLGELEAARSLAEKVVEVFSRTMPEDSSYLQKTRQGLASILVDLGDLAGARALEEKILDVWSRTLPDDHPDLQTARMNFAATLKALGDTARARALDEKVLEVDSRTLPDDHPDLQAARGNLAATLRSLGDLEGARVLEERVLEVYSRTLPEDHPDVLTARQNLATTLRALGDVAGARDLEEAVVEVRSRSFPEDHPDLQAVRLNLAGTRLALGDLPGAKELVEKVLDIWSKTMPSDHPGLQSTRKQLLLTIAAEAAVGRGTAEARRRFSSVATTFTRAIARIARNAVLTSSGREAEERCTFQLPDLGWALSCAAGLGVFEVDPGLEREAFVTSEGQRGAALAAARLRRRAASVPSYQDLRREARRASSDLARLAQSGSDVEELDAARDRREKAERELAALARDLSGDEEGLIGFDASALSASLSEHEAVIGYRRYPKAAYEPAGRDAFQETDSLCAFVLRSGDRLECVDLGPIEVVEDAVGDLRRAIGAGEGRGIGASPGGGTGDGSVIAAGEVVRGIVFDPLLPWLDGADTLVVALDDVLHLVPLDTLPLANVQGSGESDRALLGDRWQIETRCTLQELLWSRPPVPSCEALLAMGGPDFDGAPLPFSAEEDPLKGPEGGAPAEVSYLLRGGAWEAGFEPLVQTALEADGIAVLFRGAFRQGEPAFVLEGRRASCSALVELAPQARFLHVATHGWFAPESIRSIADPEPLDRRMHFGARQGSEERAEGMSPMLLAGLALSGANLHEDELGRVPGLITAEELSTLDLSGCELAVVSACDTNVGRRRAGQGVASLQKALHMAGARTVITSLWKVPDDATRELMLDFYRRMWVEKKPKGQALWEAKKRLREAGRPPRDWAAWVLTGDPE